MALLPGETYDRGFVRSATGTTVTYSTTGAAFRNGFLRSPDGRLVIKNA